MPAVAASMDGTFYMALISFWRDSDQGGLYVARSDDGGRGFRIFPWVAADEAGSVYVVWYNTRNDPDGRLLDLYSARSDDGGRSFGANRRITPSSFDPGTDLAEASSGTTMVLPPPAE